jgi:hypothetical protein
MSLLCPSHDGTDQLDALLITVDTSRHRVSHVVKFLGHDRGIGKAHAASDRDKPPQDDDGAGDGGSSGRSPPRACRHEAGRGHLLLARRVVYIFQILLRLIGCLTSWRSYYREEAGENSGVAFGGHAAVVVESDVAGHPVRQQALSPVFESHDIIIPKIPKRV